MAKAVGMKKQGSWLNWEEAWQKKLFWNDIWITEPATLGIRDDQTTNFVEDQPT